MLATILVLAYFSPETMLPLSSVIATIAGFALLIKRSSVRFVVHCVRSAFRRRPRATPAARPHLSGRPARSGQEARS